MRTLICLFMLIASIAHSAAGQQGPAPSSPNPSASSIPVGEAHFTPEQLKEYYLVYMNADVRYLRKLFASYLQRGTTNSDEFDLLKPWDPGYFRSKFVVLSRDENTFGGAFITIIFQDKPDKVFKAWVYPEGSKRKLTLRKFDLGQYSDEDINRIQSRYRTILRDKEHAM